MVAIKAHFDGRVIVPDEPVDLPRNQILMLHIEPLPTPPADGSSALAWLAENAVDDPSLPEDLSINLEHYLYGTPKRDP
jgi:hypothetical protein